MVWVVVSGCFWNFLDIHCEMLMADDGCDFTVNAAVRAVASTSAAPASVVRYKCFGPYGEAAH